MTQPRPAPVKPQPILDDPHAGQYQVVVSFRVAPDETLRILGRDGFRQHLAWILRHHYGTNRDLADLDVAVREIGVGGEASEHEGTVGLP